MTGRTMCLLLACTVAAGCAGQAANEDLDARSFVRADGVVEPEPELAGPPAPEIPVLHLTAQERIADASVSAGSPQMDPNAPSADGSPVLIDELVGEVNGQPIFANEFLSEVSDRITQIPNAFEREAGRPPNEGEWQQRAIKIIHGELERMVTDELISAESYRKLDVPEANLRRFLEAVRNNEISLRGGAAASADRSIQEETGLSTDELLEMRGDEVVLIQYLQSFRAGISVSPRDIERYYRANPEKYNPDPTVRFWWIKVEASDTDAVLRIGDELAETATEDVHEAFTRLSADEANQFSPSTNGLREPPPFKGELADQVFVNPKTPLNDALVTLSPGEFAGPIEHGGFVSWVYLESLTQLSISLYDAQAMIEAELRRQEFDRRLNIEIRRLQERAGISPEQLFDISVRLLEIATDRYL